MNNRCKQCGWNNPGNNQVCLKCGAPLGSTEETYGRSAAAHGTTVDDSLSGTGVKCPKCGYIVRPTAKQCPNCGAEMAGKIPKETIPDTSHAYSYGNETVTGTGKFSEEATGVSAERQSTAKSSVGKKLVGILVSYSQNPNGFSFPIYEGRNIIGRKTGKTSIQGDGQVSEQHCVILYRAADKKFRFKDLQSSNGTLINGKLKDEGELKNLDIITVGATKLLFLTIPEF